MRHSPRNKDSSSEQFMNEETIDCEVNIYKMQDLNKRYRNKEIIGKR